MARTEGGEEEIVGLDMLENEERDVERLRNDIRQQTEMTRELREVKQELEKTKQALREKEPMQNYFNKLWCSISRHAGYEVSQRAIVKIIESDVIIR